MASGVWITGVRYGGCLVSGKQSQDRSRAASCCGSPSRTSGKRFCKPAHVQPPHPPPAHKGSSKVSCDKTPCEHPHPQHHKT